MTRAGGARLALMALPPQIRAERGEEMAATLLEATDGASSRQVGRELAGLMRAGLALRAGAAARVAPGRLVADGVCLAGVWILTLDLATLLGEHIRGEHGALLDAWSIGALALVLAIALVGADRIAGVAALAWTASRVPALHAAGRTAGELISTALLPALCFTVMVVRPRQRAADLRRLGWLAVPLALAAILGPPPWEQKGVLVAAVVVAAVLAAVAALAVLRTDPRLAIAGAIPLSDLASRAAAHPAALTPAAIAVLAVAPAIVLTGALRARDLRREGMQVL